MSDEYQSVCQLTVRCGWKHQNISSKFCFLWVSVWLKQSADPLIIRQISVFSGSTVTEPGSWCHIVHDHSVWKAETFSERRPESFTASDRSRMIFFDSLITWSPNTSCPVRVEEGSSTLSQPCDHVDVAPTRLTPRHHWTFFFFFFYMNLLHCQTCAVSGDRRFKQFESGVELFLCKVFFFSFLCQQKTKIKHFIAIFWKTERPDVGFIWFLVFNDMTSTELISRCSFILAVLLIWSNTLCRFNTKCLWTELPALNIKHEDKVRLRPCREWLARNSLNCFHTVHQIY